MEIAEKSKFAIMKMFTRYVYNSWEPYSLISELQMRGGT